MEYFSTFTQERPSWFSVSCRVLRVDSGSADAVPVYGCDVPFFAILFKHTSIHSQWRRMRERICLSLCVNVNRFRAIARTHTQHAHSMIYAFWTCMQQAQCSVVAHTHSSFEFHANMYVKYTCERRLIRSLLFSFWLSFFCPLLYT